VQADGAGDSVSGLATDADSPLRCEHFGRCGGCSLLDVPIAEQLAAKRARATELLAPFLDGIEPEIARPPRTPRHDRMQILYPAQPHARDGLRLGIYRRGSHEIEPIRDCRIQAKALTAFGVRAAEAMRELDLPAYDETTGRGLVRALRVRVMPGTGELIAGVVATRREVAARDRLATMLWDAASGLRTDQGRPLHPVGVVWNVNDRPGNVLLGPESQALLGRAWQVDEAAGLRFRVSFASFYQQNRHADAILFRPAMALLGDVAGLRVVDAYGGVGTFALRLLQAGAAHATIVEASPSACDDARANLRDNGPAGGFAGAEVREQRFGQAPLPPCDLLVADPPRAGLLADGAACVLAAAPPRVLLVSCALESLARDLAALAGAYRMAALRLCDLFPHTDHVEAVALLVRRYAPASGRHDP
jgi:23S rRNA (uracil1939-C5)-methyltransferase